MIVCHCEVVSDRAIRAAARAGAQDASQVIARCGAGGACGGCLPAIEQLLADASDAVREPALVGARQAARRASRRDGHECLEGVAAVA